LFDFRLGEEAWPEKAELIGGKSTHWETQKDQSKALVLEPKQRLKLPLDEIKDAAGYFGNLDAYTLTIDMKLPESLEKQSLSLYQTRLKRKQGNTNEGEAMINESGGVGNFGNYGDTSKVKLELGRRQRVVVTVDCKGDGTMTTYIDGKKSAVVTRSGMFIPGERFSLDCEKGIYMFSSGKDDFMPGGVAIILIRIDSYCMTEVEVKQQRMRDRVFNIWDIERKKEAKKMQAQLSLKPLYARPPPMWMCPSFSGLLADAFVQGSVLEGGVLGSAFAVRFFFLTHNHNHNLTHIHTGNPTRTGCDDE